jgi:hypothetical protein
VAISMQWLLFWLFDETEKPAGRADRDPPPAAARPDDDGGHLSDGLRGTAELQSCSKGEQTVYLPPGKAHSSSFLLSGSHFLRSFKEISSHCSRPQTLELLAVPLQLT